MNLLNIFSELDYKAIIEGSLTNLIPTIIAGGFALFVIDKMTSYIRISKKMESYGFKGTASKKGFSKTDIKKMCKDTERLDIIFITETGSPDEDILGLISSSDANVIDQYLIF